MKNILNEVIREDNVQRLAEMIAIKALKTVASHSNGKLDYLYKGLLFDVYKRNTPNHKFSDGYDFAQTAMLFLWEHKGQKLGDYYGKNGKGKLKEAKTQEGIFEAGIYFLIGQKESYPAIYVGETLNGIERINQHNLKKDWWNKAILFLASNFKDNHIKGLEAYCYEKLKSSESIYKVDNDSTPKQYNKGNDLLFIKSLYKDIDLLMSHLGYPLEPINTTIIEMQDKVYYGRSKKFKCRCSINNGEYILLSGSEINMQKAPNESFKQIIELREQLLSDGTIKLENGKYILTKNYPFKFPSSAGIFVVGGTINGWTFWRNKEGKTLDELFRQ